MTETIETPEMPWHVMQRNLAATTADTGSYAIVRKASQPHWVFTPVTDSWLRRARDNPPRR